MKRIFLGAIIAFPMLICCQRQETKAAGYSFKPGAATYGKAGIYDIAMQGFESLYAGGRLSGYDQGIHHRRNREWRHSIVALPSRQIQKAKYLGSKTPPYGLRDWNYDSPGPAQA